MAHFDQERVQPQTKTAATSSNSEEVFDIGSARASVFTTAELLENILRLLPHRCVYSAYRVCRQWQALIDSSNLLQEKLFLKPS